MSCFWFVSLFPYLQALHRPRSLHQSLYSDPWHQTLDWRICCSTRTSASCNKEIQVIEYSTMHTDIRWDNPYSVILYTMFILRILSNKPYLLVVAQFDSCIQVLIISNPINVLYDASIILPFTDLQFNTAGRFLILNTFNSFAHIKKCPLQAVAFDAQFNFCIWVLTDKLSIMSVFCTILAKELDGQMMVRS